MKEILSYELCKRLYDAGVRVETEYQYGNIDTKYIFTGCEPEYEVVISDTFNLLKGESIFLEASEKGLSFQKFPALTIVDGLELMKEHIKGISHFSQWSITLWKSPDCYEGKTLKEVVEKSLIYLLNNKLIGQTN